MFNLLKQVEGASGLNLVAVIPTQNAVSAAPLEVRLNSEERVEWTVKFKEFKGLKYDLTC